jgi:hypothetical protein
MALVILQPGLNPLGQYDAVDSIATTVKGGEVLTFTTVLTSADKAAADAADGYINPGTSRVALTTNIQANSHPLMLCDDGLLHYGTLFGTVVGGTVGQTSYGLTSTVPSSALLGPHTATGSGKLTAWDKPGLYGVTLDAVDDAPTTGLVPTNPTLTAGSEVYAQVNNGILTAASTNNFGVGWFVEFHTNGSLVTTPNRLVSALNSPSSTVSGTLPNSYYMAVFNFQPWSHL